LGSRFTWKKVFDKTKSVVRALDSFRLKKGDTVSSFVGNIPEFVYLMLATSYLGVTLDTIPLYGDSTIEKLSSRLNINNSKLFFVMDVFHSARVKQAVAQSNITETIVVPTLNSSILKFPLSFLNVLKNPKNLFSNDKYMKWNQFIKGGAGRRLPEEVAFEPNMPALILNSSGTTGLPKGVVHSSESLVNKAKSYKATGVNLDRGLVFYPIPPNWFSTGASSSIITPMFYGAELFLDPRVNQEVFVRNLLKYDIHYTVSSNALWEGFLDDDLVRKYYHPKKRNLKNLLFPFQGGEPQNPDIVKKMQVALEKYGFEMHLLNGYGSTENGPGIATQTPAIHTPGSSGIPLPGINIRILDDEGKLRKINESGEIQVCNPESTMLGYFDDKEASEYFVHENGVTWNKVEDYGRVDENGEIYVEGRTSDYTLINNKRIYNFLITKILSNNHALKNVATYTHESGDSKIMVVHLMLGEELYDEMMSNNQLLVDKIRQLQGRVYEEMQDIDWVPEHFKIYSSFPIHANAKRDIIKMIEENDSIITISPEF
jgi:acyl-coenzyme A synthetase/AMP-(fatty) acid ligase